MKRSIEIVLLVLVIGSGLSQVGLAQNGAGSITGAAGGAFAGGASLAGVSLRSIDAGTGVFLEPGGSGSGVFEAVLSGRSVLGQARQITLEGNVTNGTMSADGGASFGGLATVNLGDGTPALANVPFTVTMTANSLTLAIDSTNLPAATLTSGAVAIE